MDPAAPGLVRGVVFRVLPSLVLFGGLEMGLRAFDLPRGDTCWYSSKDFWQPEPDPELGWLYRPGLVVAGVAINERGMGGPVLPPAKPPGHDRILYVGDSTVYGLGVPPGQSFAARASALLQADRPGRVVEYEVAALPGYSSHHSRVLVRRMLSQQPDLVLFYVGAHNDHSRARFYRDGEIPQRMARRRAAWHQVHVLRLLENGSDRAYRELFRQLRSPAGKARVPPDAFRANLRDMVRRVRDAGAVPLLLAPPFSAFGLADHPIIPRYREILRQVAREEGSLFVDLHERFRGRPESEIFRDDHVHLSAQGHALTAEAIAAAVRGEATF